MTSCRSPRWLVKGVIVHDLGEGSKVASWGMRTTGIEMYANSLTVRLMRHMKDSEAWYNFVWGASHLGVLGLRDANTSSGDTHFDTTS
jgi:hypothetical protein